MSRAERDALIAALKEPFSSATDAEPVDPVAAYRILFNEPVSPALVDFIAALYAEQAYEEPGYVYVFRWTRAPAHVLKIGHSYDASGRLTQWRNTLEASATELQAITRVFSRNRMLTEEVVHALLEARRRPQPNVRLGVFHREFFEIRRTRALQYLLLATARHVSYYVHDDDGLFDTLATETS